MTPVPLNGDKDKRDNTTIGDASQEYFSVERVTGTTTTSLAAPLNISWKSALVIAAVTLCNALV